MQTFLTQVYLENTLMQWLIAIITGLLVFFILKLVIRLVKNQAVKLTGKSKTELDDQVVNILVRTRTLLLIILSIQAAVFSLTLPENTRQILKVITITAVLVQTGLWLNIIVNYWGSGKIGQASGTGTEKTTGFTIIRFFTKMILWSVIIVLILDNIPGIEVTTLIASLGIGGIAIGLAVQNILGDLFASLTIALDKPFAVGDTIAIGDLSGEVESIGLKSTRIRSVSGEQLIIGNNDLLSSRIRNYKRMDYRRVQETLNISYRTPKDMIEQIPAIIQQVISSQESAVFKRAHLKKLGDYTLVYEYVYNVQGPDFAEYMDVQQSINFGLYEKFSSLGIELASPAHYPLP